GTTSASVGAVAVRAGKERARQHYNSSGSALPSPRMPTRPLLALIAALLILRLPSLAQPMGADQGLYAYVGERILHGELAYRDAWDQKAPGIHYVYAALRTISRSDAMIPAADLAAAALAALLLWRIGAALGGPVA